LAGNYYKESMSVLTKIVGGIVFFIGLMIVVAFPWLTKYQFADLSRGGVLFGLIVIGIGILLMTL